MIDKYEDYPLHNSMRGWFGRELYFVMKENPKVWCLTADLGFGLLDHIRDDFPDRFVNFGASEQLMVGAACGLALDGKIPFCYSITSFLLCRPFEWLRNYVNHEQIPVKLVGAGLDDDYKHDGISHHAFDAKRICDLIPAMASIFPTSNASAAEWVNAMARNGGPYFLCLRR